MIKGIDISYYQGNVDFSKIKKQFGFVIIRVGLGDNIVNQDDVKYKEYVEGCKKYNIPYAFYLISYAKRETGSESVQSEIDHMERIAKQYNPFAIFYDLEIYHKLGKQILTNFAIKFCNYFKNKGYKTGVYANLDWFKNYLDYNILKNRGYIIWLAHYSNKPGLDCDIWQYSDKGNVEGINTNTTDLDIMYTNIIDNKPQPFEITYQIWDDVRNKWLSNVVNDRDYAGIYGHDVCCVYANSNVGNIYQRVHYKNGKWLPEVKNRSDYAGLYNKPIDGWMIKADKPIQYRVHLRRKNKWLPWVTGYNIKDSNNGFAGIIGQEIDAIQVKPI
jgi:GH25 family lysozyme M1 (1,4-beta-N-acetylmuramidase)